MATALAKFFFRAPYARPSTPEIWRWWEKRRLTYNLALLAAGLPSVGLVTLLELGSGTFEWFYIGPILAYAIMANLCYTLGPIADSLIMKVSGREHAEAGPMLFRYGFVFSVLLTLLPFPVMLLGALLDLLF
jgi:hypothetical protein